MKSVKIVEVTKIAIVAILAVGLFAALLFGINRISLNAAMRDDIYVPAVTEYISIPESPLAATTQEDNMTDSTHGMTVFDMNNGWGERNPLALSPSAAAVIGAQYIMDIFGVCIGDMYVELNYIANGVMATRPLWWAEVSVEKRHDPAQWAIMAEEFLQANPPSEEGNDSTSRSPRSFSDLRLQYGYSLANFTFVIDAITGERINIINTAVEETDQNGNPLWDVRYMIQDADFSVYPLVLDEYQMDDLLNIGLAASNRHFINTTIAKTEYGGTINTLVFHLEAGDIVFHGYSLVHVTDDTGRVASIRVCRDTMQVTSINTMINDMIPRHRH